MEFYQFHPTGIVGIGILLSEAARGEGGYLLNDAGDRFMERYAPTLMELAPRDMVSRAIYQEIRAGRGIGGKDFVYLDVRHLGRAVIEEKLADITEFARVYQGVEPITEPVPTQPTAHYAMGGIPTDVETRVIRDEHGTVVPGLYAAGEAACVSVHGANRLGTNSLVDLLVFGRRAGRRMAADVAGWAIPEIADDAAERSRGELEHIRSAPRRENAARIRSRPGRRDDGQRRRLSGRGPPDDRPATRSATCASAIGTSRSTTRAGPSTPTSWRPASSATSSTAPRPRSPRRSPGRRVAARTLARTTRPATT